jgi:hypothetical protein
LETTNANKRTDCHPEWNEGSAPPNSKAGAEFMNYPVKLAIVVSAALVLVWVPVFADAESQRRLKQLLSSQGFSGPLIGKVHISELGWLHCGAETYRVLYHQWDDSHPPGRAIHASQRLVFLADGEQYLGSYVIASKPLKVSSGSILLPYPQELGNSIACADIGDGKKIVLDGEVHTFFK